MNPYKINSIEVGLQPWPAASGVVSGFFNKRVDLRDIQKNFLSAALPVSQKQVHGDGVRVIDKESLETIRPPLEGDAFVTRLTNVALVVHTADCIPLLGFAPGIVGACHAGWRGVSREIIPRWIESMISQGAKAADLKVAIGPSIGPCHFEVGLDVADRLCQFEGKNLPVDLLKFCRLPHPNKEKAFIDLNKIAVWQLRNRGVLSENISVSSQCTFCDAEKFFSYRREGPKIGRMEAVISLIDG
jgi:polyphenol oxidase